MAIRPWPLFNEMAAFLKKKKAAMRPRTVNFFKSGHVAMWPDGRMAGWPDGRMAGWPDGRMAGWPDGRMAGWPDGRMAVGLPPGFTLN